MDLAELRAQLEEDLSWRADELRLLRNSLLGDLDKEDWPAHAMRTLLVMQYAHLEGFTQNAFHLYVRAINERRLSSDELHVNLLATSLADEFKVLRSGSALEEESSDNDDGTFLRRAKRHVSFVERLQLASKGPLYLDPDHAVSMEMNLGSDVLRKTMYMVGIPESVMEGGYFSSLEFVRRTRNDVGHGARTESIPPGRFEAHMTKCRTFMDHLVRVITLAVAQEWFRNTSKVNIDLP